MQSSLLDYVFSVLAFYKIAADLRVNNNLTLNLYVSVLFYNHSCCMLNKF